MSLFRKSKLAPEPADGDDLEPYITRLFVAYMHGSSSNPEAKQNAVNGAVYKAVVELRQAVAKKRAQGKNDEVERASWNNPKDVKDLIESPGLNPEVRQDFNRWKKYCFAEDADERTLQQLGIATGILTKGDIVKSRPAATASHTAHGKTNEKLIEATIDNLIKTWLPKQDLEAGDLDALIDVVGRVWAAGDFEAIASARKYRSALADKLPVEKRDAIRLISATILGDIKTLVDELLATYSGGARLNNAESRMHVCRDLKDAIDRVRRFEGEEVATKELEYEPAKMAHFPPQLQHEIRSMIAVVASGISEEASNSIHAKNQEAEKYYTRGIQAAMAGDAEMAIVLLTKAIELNPNDAMAYKNRGGTRTRFGTGIEDLKLAIVDFNEAIRLDPNYTEVYESRGFSKYLLDDKRGAYADFVSVIRIDPEYVFEPSINEAILREGWSLL